MVVEEGDWCYFTWDSLAGHPLLPLSLEAFWNGWEIFRHIQFSQAGVGVAK